MRRYSPPASRTTLETSRERRAETSSRDGKSADGATRPRWIRAVPNALTVLRLALAAWFPFSPEEARLAVVLAAGLSDFLDGYIARRLHAESPLGALLDGIADKGFVLSVLVTWVLEGEVHLYQVLLVMARDLTVGAVALVVVWRREWSAFGRMQVRFPGKLTTALMFGWFATMLLPWAHPAEPVLFWGAALASLLAAADYGLRFRRALHATDAPRDDPRGI